MPPSSVISPPATSVPMPSVPLIVAFTGVALASASPNITLVFLITMLLSTLSVPAIASIGLAVTLASVLIVNDVALNVAPTTGQLPSRLAMLLPLTFTVSPSLIPIVNGVYVNDSVVPFNTVPVVALLRYTYSLVTPLTVVFEGILPLPVTSIPARILLVSAIGTSVSALATTPLVFPVTVARLTTTSCDAVASYPSAKVNNDLFEELLPILMLCASPPISRLLTFVLYTLPEPVLLDVSLALPTSRPSDRSSAVPHSGVSPFDFRNALFLPMLSVFSVPVLCAYSKSPTAYVAIAVPPRVTGTTLVKLAGFRKYALSSPSSVPASTTPSLMNTSPLASVLTSNCVCKNLLTPSVENVPSGS